MDKIKVTQQQRDNLLDALHVMWPSVPPENVSAHLMNWRAPGHQHSSHVDCGTVACFGGWCTAWPRFIAQGVRKGYGGEPVVAGRARSDLVAYLLFGDISLFGIRTYHQADRGFIGTDHQVVTNRLRWLLDNSEVLA